MALVRKGSRAITVDGLRFRWSVRLKPTYSQANDWSPLSYAVEGVGDGGSLLHVTLTRPRPDNWMLEPSFPLRPREVAQTIRRALKLGWKPFEHGPPFEFTEDVAPSEP